MIDRRVTNVLLNGLAVMLAYAGMLGGAIIMPTIFKEMKGDHGLSEKTAFYGLMICNTAVILIGPFTPSITKLLGTRTSVIISVILCGTINNVLFYPTDYLIYGAFFLNGIGCALLRVAALTYMTKNSQAHNLSRHTTIHWMMFTVGLMLGNTVVMVLNIRTSTIDKEKRFAIAIGMSILCWLAISGYFFTKHIPENYDEILASYRREQIRAAQAQCPDEDTAMITSFPYNHEPETPNYIPLLERSITEEQVSSYEIIKKMLAAMRRRETVLLLAPMFAGGVFCTAYSPILPTAIGNVAPQKTWLISAFGILVGVGQLCGAFLTGKSIDKVGTKHIAIINTLLSLITFGMMALVLDMGFDDRWPGWMKFSEVMVLIVAYFVGVMDMINNVCITVIIGRVYKEDNDAAFSCFITIMSVSMVLWYLLNIVIKPWLLLTLYCVVTVASAASFSILKFEQNDAKRSENSSYSRID